MKIITVPHPKLKQKSSPVTQVDKKLIQFVHDLEQTLIHKKNPEGVGLSAPQVAVNLRLFCTYLDQDGAKQIRTFINPKITRSSPKLTLGGKPDKPFLEGCLSIPNIYGPVYRHQWIKLTYQIINPDTLSLEPRAEHFDSFPARVIQHETDHLEGILFTERAIQQGLPLYREENNQLVEFAYQ